MSINRGTLRRASPSSKSRAQRAQARESQPLPLRAGEPGDRFDAAYFRRYYFDPATRVTDAREMQRRANLIAAVLVSAQLPVRSILDAGCGTGLLRKAFAAALPRAKYAGLEASAYLCRRYGWHHGELQSFSLERPVDLVVCYDVLQYLDDTSARHALRKLVSLTRCAVYFSALTRKDWRDHCDRTRTDGAVHLRSAEWYRRRLRIHFAHLGYGVWVPKDVCVIGWELERS